MIEDEDSEYEEEEKEEAIDDLESSNTQNQQIEFKLYCLLSSLENFYSRIQSTYKRVSATWLIASFIGMGYVFSVDGSNLPLDPLLILILIAFAAMWGISLLWFLDIYIFQTYFYGVVLEQAKFEKKYKWMPFLNIPIISLQCHSKTRTHQSLFYAGCILILLFIICAGVIAFLQISAIFSTLICFGFVLIGWLLTSVMLRTEHPTKSPIREKFLKTSSRKKS